jgi:hypothetical protein
MSSERGRAGERPIFVTVSGSFRRHLTAIQDAVAEFSDAGAFVLSPADPRIVDSFGEFVFVSSDLRRSIKGVQNRHLEAIRRSDFLWLACPDGYVGASASLELGYAAAVGVPVYSDAAPTDWTLRQYVTPVGNPAHALAAAGRDQFGIESELSPSLLLAPEAGLAEAHRELDLVRHHLLNDRIPREEDPVEASVDRIRRIVKVPTRP